MNYTNYMSCKTAHSRLMSKVLFFPSLSPLSPSLAFSPLLADHSLSLSMSTAIFSTSLFHYCFSLSNFLLGLIIFPLLLLFYELSLTSPFVVMRISFYVSVLIIFLVRHAYLLDLEYYFSNPLIQGSQFIHFILVAWFFKWQLQFQCLLFSFRLALIVL